MKLLYKLLLAVVLLVGATASFVEAPTFTHTIYGYGVASWYGKWHHGKKMSNGKKFDMNKITVAHKYLPLGTVLHIKNLVNNRVILATVTDRGPYIDGRELDLSHAAAIKLGFVKSGLTFVMYRKWRGR